jgi:hypothetical protein
MGGILGGLLGLVEPLGGYFLSLLIGGQAAWKESGGGKVARLTFGGMLGGIIIGGIIGGFLFLLSPAEASDTTPTPGIGLSVFLGAFLGFWVFPFVVAILEAIRRALEP